MLTACSHGKLQHLYIVASQTLNGTKCATNKKKQYSKPTNRTAEICCRQARPMHGALIPV